MYGIHLSQIVWRLDLSFLEMTNFNTNANLTKCEIGVLVTLLENSIIVQQIFLTHLK